MSGKQEHTLVNRLICSYCGAAMTVKVENYGDEYNPPDVYFRCVEHCACSQEQRVHLQGIIMKGDN